MESVDRMVITQLGGAPEAACWLVSTMPAVSYSQSTVRIPRDSRT
jgi:hypothetical protein